MGELLKICGIALLCAAAAVIVGKSAGGVGVAVKLGGAVVALGLVVSLLLRAVEYLQGIGASFVPSEYLAVMLKALGVCAICRICSDICRDCGEHTASGAVESAAKLTLVLMSLPILQDLIEYASQISRGISL